MWPTPLRASCTPEGMSRPRRGVTNRGMMSYKRADHGGTGEVLCLGTGRGCRRGCYDGCTVERYRKNLHRPFVKILIVCIVGLGVGVCERAAVNP